MDIFAQAVVYGMGAGALDALLALGIVLVYRTTGVLNFAQAAIGAFAGYVMYSAANGRSLASLWFAIPAGLAAGAALGAATYLLIRNIRSRNFALTAAVATLAVSILLEQLVRVFWGTTVGGF